MAADFTLLFTDIVDSTAVNSRLGDAGMAALWDAHDRLSRELLRRWNGREVDRSDGFLLLFDDCAGAVAFSAEYHRMLATLAVPLAARAGIHVGPLTLRDTPAAEVALGVKPVEVLGIAKAIGARVMALAQSGQTLLSATAQAVLATSGEAERWRCLSHGHWRLKGLEQPLELFEVGDENAPMAPPPDSGTGQRVAMVDGQWMLVREVPHSLPAEREAIVDRQHEVALLVANFRGGTRLVTITGAGGMGKTRLALRYAWAWLGDHPGGVWFCDLSSARELDGVVFAVGQGLDVPLGKDPLAQLARAIAGRGECLVVLDNFEQVRKCARDTLGRWLDAAPRARFMVTSREVLGLPGEHTLALAPLTAQDGARLFHQRASAAHAGHDPDAWPLETQQLIALLDGMPLAIELAAPRVRVMAPPVLLARMGDRFRLLSTSDGRPDRQATLRATLAWSWDLLTAAERSMLAQLSVFEGGFTWAAVQQVVALDDAAGTPWMIDVLQSLVEKSLVSQLANGRFGLLRSVQEFAAEQLQADGCFAGSGGVFAAATRRRHHRHHAQLDEAAATADGCAELDNLVCACRQAVRDGDGDDAVACLRLAWAALRFTGPFQVSATLADQVRQMPGLASAQAAEAERLLAATLRNLGANAAARTAAERGLAACRDSGEPGVRAGLHCLLAEMAMASGDFDTCSRLLTTALDLAQAGGDPAIQCTVLNVCGVQQQYQGRLPQARGHYETGLAIATTAGLRRWEGGFLGNLAGLDYAVGRLDDARATYEQALRVAVEIGNRQWQGDAHCNLGLIHLEQGRLDDAQAQLLAALAHAQTLGYSRLADTVNCNLGLLFQRRGQWPQAIERFAMAADGALAAGDSLYAVQYLGHLAPAQARQGDIAAASATLDRADGLLLASADAQTLGLLACSRSEVASRSGDPAGAAAALQAACQHLASSGANAASELGRRAAEVTALLQAADSGVAPVSPC